MRWLNFLVLLGLLPTIFGISTSKEFEAKAQSLSDNHKPQTKHRRLHNGLKEHFKNNHNVHSLAKTKSHYYQYKEYQWLDDYSLPRNQMFLPFQVASCLRQWRSVYTCEASKAVYNCILRDREYNIDNPFHPVNEKSSQKQSFMENWLREFYSAEAATCYYVHDNLGNLEGGGRCTLEQINSCLSWLKRKGQI